MAKKSFEYFIVRLAFLGAGFGALMLFYGVYIVIVG